VNYAALNGWKCEACGEKLYAARAIDKTGICRLCRFHVEREARRVATEKRALDDNLVRSLLEPVHALLVSKVGRSHAAIADHYRLLVRTGLVRDGELPEPHEVERIMSLR